MTTETIQTDITDIAAFDFRTWDVFETYTHHWAEKIIAYAVEGCYDRNERRYVTKKFNQTVKQYLHVTKPKFPAPDEDTPNDLILNFNVFLNDLYAAAERVRKDGPF